MSKSGRTDRLFNFCLDPIKHKFSFCHIESQFIGNELIAYLTSPDLKKPQGSRCRCQLMLGEYHPHTFLVANLINN